LLKMNFMGNKSKKDQSGFSFVWICSRRSKCCEGEKEVVKNKVVSTKRQKVIRHTFLS
jgi:hypothetical protein